MFRKIMPLTATPKKISVFSVLEALGFGVLLIDEQEHEIVYANRMAIKMSGHTLVQIISAKCHKLVCPAEVGLCPITDLGNDVDNSERKLVRADGTLLPIIKTVVPVMLNGRKYLIESFVDNSERKSLEERLVQKNNELAETFEAIKKTQAQMIYQEKLAAGVAHEINNPLGFITGNFEMLEQYFSACSKVITQYGVALEQIPDPGDGSVVQIKEGLARCEQENDLEYILGDLPQLFADTTQGLHRISKIVKGMRLFSRVDQQQVYEKYNLVEGLENTLIVAHNEIKHWASVKKDFVPIPEIAALRDELNQVLLNLIVNAAQAIKSTGNFGEIKITIWQDETSVYCSIEDNGPGIADKDMDHIFNPFFTTKPVGQGTGLGLSISYDIIVNRHHGKISAESTVGSGAIFTLQLPIRHTE